MYRLFALAGVLGMALTFAVQAEDDKAASIDEIMEKAHSGKKSLIAIVKTAVEKKAYGDAAKPSEEWAKLASQLGKNKQPKGEADSWKKLTGEYEKQVKDLAAAIKDKKGEDAAKALKAIGSGCKSCHDMHKSQ